MATRRELELLLKDLGRAFAPHPRDAQALLVAGTNPHDEPLTLRLDPPLLTVRLRMGDADALRPETMRRMLLLNAQMLVLASFGIRGDDAVLEASLPLERLDAGELGAALGEMDLVRGEALA
jgi:hypothetical protein